MVCVLGGIAFRVSPVGRIPLAVKCLSGHHLSRRRPACLLLAPLRHADPSDECRLLGEKRKSLGRRQADADELYGGADLL
jgi:hypothetical protein